MEILVVLLLCAQAFALPANQPVQTPQDLLQKVLAANPLENDISIGLEETANAKENDNRVVNNPEQVVQMLQKVLQKEEAPTTTATTEQDQVTLEPDYDVINQPLTEVPIEISDTEVSIRDTESSNVPNTEGDKYAVTADVGIITFDPTIEVIEEKPKSEATEQVHPNVQDDLQNTTPEESSLNTSEGDNAGYQTESTNQLQENSDPSKSTDTETEQSLDLTTDYPEKQEPISEYKPIIFPDDIQPQQQEKIAPNEGTPEIKDVFNEEPYVPQLPVLDTAQIELIVDDTIDFNIQISDEENPIGSSFDTLPLEPTLENTEEENSDSIIETPLEYNPQETPFDAPLPEENPELQIPVEDRPIDMVPEQGINESPVQSIPELLAEDPIEDSSLNIPLDSLSPPGDSIFEPEPAEQDTTLYNEDPVENNPSIQPFEIVPLEKTDEGILAEENPFLSPIDTLPLEPFNEDVIPEIPSHGVPAPEYQIPLDMAIAPSENIPENVESTQEEPLDPLNDEDPLSPPNLGENPLFSPALEPTLDETEAILPEITGNEDINPDTTANTNYPGLSINETPETSPFGFIPPERPIDNYPGSSIFNENQENTPYKPIHGMDENFVSGQFYPSSNNGAKEHFKFPQHAPGLDEISDSFEYNPYDQVPFISSQIEPHYNPYWGFPDIYEAPTFGKRHFLNPRDRYIGNKYFDKGTYNSFPGNMGANRDFYGYNQQQSGPGIEELPVREMAMNVNTGDNSERVNSFIPDGGRPLFPTEGDSFHMQYDSEPKATIPSHKFVPMVRMPPINRHHPISESMTPYEEPNTFSHQTKDQSLQLPIFNKNQMQDPIEGYNSYDNPQDPNYNTYFVVDPNIPQVSEDLPLLNIDEQNQVVPNRDEEFTQTKANTEKDTKFSTSIQGTDLPMESSQGFANPYYPRGEKVPEISPSTYTGPFEQQYFDDAYMPNIYPQKAPSGNTGAEHLSGLSSANRNIYLEDTYNPFDRSPYYSGGRFRKPYYNYRDEYYY